MVSHCDLHQATEHLVMRPLRLRTSRSPRTIRDPSTVKDSTLQQQRLQ